MSFESSAQLLENKKYAESGDSNETTSELSVIGVSGYDNYRNLGSAIFNLMNAVIGAGIISLGLAASVLGTVHFTILLALVVAMSVFTMVAS